MQTGIGASDQFSEKGVRSMKIRFLILGLVIFMVSCGSGSKSSEQVVSEISAASSISIAPGPISGSLTSGEAGQTYLEIVNSVNCTYREIVDLQNANSLGDGTADPAVLPELQALFGVLASAREIAVRSFLGSNWPESVKSDIDLLAREWSKGARAERALAEAVDQGAYTLDMNGYNALMSASSANPGFIRATLGVGPASETDHC